MQIVIINLNRGTEKHNIIETNKYVISPLLLSMESIDTTYSSYVTPGMGEIITTFIKPWKHTVNSIGDTGANINAISQTVAH